MSGAQGHTCSLHNLGLQRCLLRHRASAQIVNCPCSSLPLCKSRCANSAIQIPGSLGMGTSTLLTWDLLCLLVVDQRASCNPQSSITMGAPLPLVRAPRRRNGVPELCGADIPDIPLSHRRHTFLYRIIPFLNSTRQTDCSMIAITS